jgi:UDP-3-O-[3-hydroxymyristoyl] glucosamine N-acyltransferase
LKDAKPVALEALARAIGGRYTGEGSLPIRGVAPLDAAREGELAFVTNPKYAKAAAETRASAILASAEVPGVAKPHLLCANPYAALARLIGLFHPARAPKPGVRRGAFVEKGAKVSPRACVMPGATVSRGAKVGARTVLYPGVFVGEDASIGEDCILHPNAVVREGCVLGDRVILQPGAVIGGDGFGFAPEGGAYLKIPQVGNVVLEDDVEVGACTCVDRAVLGSTRVGKGTKLDNLIQVAHNVVIGRHGVLAAQAGISGSTVVGDHATVGGQVGLAGHLRIGNNVTLAAQSGIMDDIPDGAVFFGYPAQPMAAEMKCAAAYRELPELLRRVRRLEKRIEGLASGPGA